MNLMSRAFWRRLALLTAGTTLFLSGCDPTIQSTVQSGIISAANGLLTAFLTALTQLNTTTTTGT